MEASAVQWCSCRGVRLTQDICKWGCKAIMLCHCLISSNNIVFESCEPFWHSGSSSCEALAADGLHKEITVVAFWHWSSGFGMPHAHVIFHHASSLRLPSVALQQLQVPERATSAADQSLYLSMSSHISYKHDIGPKVAWNVPPA